MFYHENKYLNYHLTTLVNFGNFTFCGTIWSKIYKLSSAYVDFFR